MLNIKEMKKEDILNNIGELNKFFNKFKKFNLKKVSNNKGATERGKTYTGGSFNIFSAFKSYSLKGEPVFLLESELRLIRSSPILIIKESDNNNFVITTENSVYELETEY